MLAIWTYTFGVVDSFALEMPRGAIVLTTQMQHGKPTMWARLDPKALKVKTWFRVLGTGHLHEEDEKRWRYIGTWQDGEFVWHLFQELA